MFSVCYCGNKKIIGGIGLSLLSIAKVTPHPISCYILTADVSYIKKEYVPIEESDRLFFEKIIRRFNDESRVYLIDASQEFKETFSLGRNMHSMYTPFAFLRLLMDQIPSLPDRVLYLDTDTVALKDVTPLFEADLFGHDIGVVHDPMREKEYFNSGVMLFNLKEIRNDGSFKQARNYIFANKLMMPDQDALNVVYKDNRTFLSNDFNEQRKTKGSTVIRHYCQAIHFFPYFHIIKAKPFDKEKFAKAYKKDSKLPIFAEFEALKKEYIQEEE